MSDPMSDPVGDPVTSAEFVLEIRRYDDPVAQQLVAELQQDHTHRYGGPDRTNVDPAEFTAPHGLFLVGWLAGAAVACGGWRVHEEPVDGGSAVEVKRMYVAAAARRHGLAREVLAELERTAAAAGHRYVVLITGRGQPEAIALYQACGYQPVAPYGYYRNSSGARFFGRPLCVECT